jgi:hypothetical protein
MGVPESFSPRCTHLVLTGAASRGARVTEGSRKPRKFVVGPDEQLVPRRQTEPVRSPTRMEPDAVDGGRRDVAPDEEAKDDGRRELEGKA